MHLKCSVQNDPGEFQIYRMFHGNQQKVVADGCVQTVP